MNNFDKPKGYLIKLSFDMCMALCDIAEKYEGEDSPRYNTRTIKALTTRGLISGVRVVKLTKKGHITLNAALNEMFEHKAPRHQSTASRMRRQSNG